MKKVTQVHAAALPMLGCMTMSGRAQSVSTDYDHETDFSPYHTFSLYKVQASDPLVADRITTEISKELTAKGLQQASTGADVNVTAVESTKDKQEYNTFYDGLGGGGFGWGGWRGWGGGWGGGTSDASTTVTQVPVGTLMVDVYDSKTTSCNGAVQSMRTYRTRPRRTPPS